MEGLIAKWYAKNMRTEAARYSLNSWRGQMG